ncbi:MAG: tetratricopeptide repeat protein, partial [Candidatus Omnitrophota bacterium]
HKISLRYPRIINYGLISIITLFSLLSMLRNYEYKNPLVFWQVSVERNPKSFLAYDNLAREYKKMGAFREAEWALKKALNYAYPLANKKRVALNLAKLYSDFNYPDKAIDLVNSQVLNAAPIPEGAYNFLGAIHLKTGNEKDGLKALRQEMMRFPQKVDPYINLGIYYIKKEEFDKAEDSFIEALKRDPDNRVAREGLILAKSKQKLLKE